MVSAGENADDADRVYCWFLTPEPNGVGEGVLGIGRVLRRRRRRRRRDGICVWTP